MASLNIVQFKQEDHSHLIDELTDLLHSAYKPLAKEGMRYLATHQTADVTLDRLKKGDSFLGFIDGKLIATITLIIDNTNAPSGWYSKPGVFVFSQFAVHPKFQGSGLGSTLMDFIEKYAKEAGANEIALDTSENAHHLIEMYKKRGYRFVEYADWEVTNYRSVILSRTL